MNFLIFFKSLKHKKKGPNLELYVENIFYNQMGLKHLKLIYARWNLVQDAHYFYKKLLCTFVNAKRYPNAPCDMVSMWQVI